MERTMTIEAVSGSDYDYDDDLYGGSALKHSSVWNGRDVDLLSTEDAGTVQRVFSQKKDDPMGSMQFRGKVDNKGDWSVDGVLTIELGKENKDSGRTREQDSKESNKESNTEKTPEKKTE
jgi:hypothetical protein